MKANNVKDIVITFRISVEEFEPYKKAIDTLNIKKSEFFRAIITDSFDPKIHDKKSKKDAEKLLFYYNKTSNNINQIAKKINKADLEGKLNDVFLMKMLNSIELISESLLNGIEEFKNEK